MSRLLGPFDTSGVQRTVELRSSRSFDSAVTDPELAGLLVRTTRGTLHA
jgi:hypothetical protein